MLDSWANARGVKDTQFVFSLEPLAVYRANLEMIADFYERTQAECTIIVNNVQQGPAKNHFTALQAAYDLGANYLILGEEDITVSADALEYMRWGFDYIDASLNTALVCGYSTRDEGAVEAVRKVPGFPNCWLWGTSRYWWKHYVGKYWDSDFSTGTGNERGWDWNLSRVMNEWGWHSLQPDASRAQNIGELGWSTGPGSVVKVPTFDQNRSAVEYNLI